MQYIVDSYNVLIELADKTEKNSNKKGRAILLNMQVSS